MGILKCSLFSPGRDEHDEETHVSCLLTLCSSIPRLMKSLETYNLYTTQVVPVVVQVWPVTVRDYDD